MLEGLEISEISKVDLERTTRIDSEFYSKENLHIIDILKKLPLNNITQLVKVSDGNHMSISENFSEYGVPYYRGQDIHRYFIEDSTPICIDEASFYKPVMKRSHLKEGDVLLSIVGTIGGVSLVSSNRNATCSCKLAIFRPFNVDGYFLSAFLKSKYGQNQIKKFTRGAIQMGLILEDMNQILIPDLSNVFQIAIRACITLAKNKSKLSIELYNNAEILLLETLGLKNFEPTAEAVNIKSFKESFLNYGRLDAEYYQKKYYDYIDLICNNHNGYEIIEVACQNKDINYTPKDNTEYKYIELANIGKTGDIKGCTIAAGSELPTRARRKVNTNDVIISSIEGSLDSCAIITDEYDNALCSTGFYVLTSNKINSETLLVLFKSEPTQQILKKGCSGTILTAISKSEFQNIPIPLIDIQIQEKIASLVSESFTLKKQSEQLLETAKRAVEIAIEQNEEAAKMFIDSDSPYQIMGGDSVTSNLKT